MAKSTIKANPGKVKHEKVTYTWQGMTFSTGSKVVARMWAQGKFESAVNRYISDTSGRQLRNTPLHRTTRLNIQKKLKTGDLYKSDVREIVETSRERVPYIVDNMGKWYSDALQILNHSQHEETRNLSRTIQNIIERYANRYSEERNVEMAQKINHALDTIRKQTNSKEVAREIMGALESTELVASMAKGRESLRQSKMAFRKNHAKVARQHNKRKR